MTTITIWIPESDLENFINKERNFTDADKKLHRYFIQRYNEDNPITIYTEKRHIELLQLNVSLDLFVKLNLK